MNQQERQEARWLGWIEGTLDPADHRLVEEERSADSALATRLDAMQQDRDRIAHLVDPESPADLFDQVERVAARPMLAPAQPGQYRRVSRVGAFRVRMRGMLPMAAMILIGFGLLAALILLNPIQRLFPASEDVASNTTPSTPGAIPSFLAGRSEPGSPEDDHVVVETSPELIEVVQPTPLALVLPPSGEEETLAMLRSLALRTKSTLLVNASPADLMDPALEASIPGPVSSDRPVPALMEVEGIILGDADRLPSIEDQFAYARQGAIWTVTLSLDEFDAFLLVLDELAEDKASLLLLEDHLDLETSGSPWMRAMRARVELNRWRIGNDDAMIVVPVFLETDEVN